MDEEILAEVAQEPAIVQSVQKLGRLLSSEREVI